MGSSSDEISQIPMDPDLDPRLDPMAPGGAHDPNPHRRATLAVIACGGALGTAARYAIDTLLSIESGDVPVASLSVNLSGSLMLGFIVVLLIERFPPSRFLRPFLGVGFLGSYTTYSAFAVDTAVLFNDGHLAVALVYAAATLLGGVVAAGVGIVAGHAAFGAGS
jgi:CrcB protein